jgi:hypothetical protein
VLALVNFVNVTHPGNFGGLGMTGKPVTGPSTVILFRNRQNPTMSNGEPINMDEASGPTLAPGRVLFEQSTLCTPFFPQTI